MVKFSVQTDSKAFFHTYFLSLMSASFTDLSETSLQKISQVFFSLKTFMITDIKTPYSLLNS